MVPFDAFAGVAKVRLKDFVSKVLANPMRVFATAGRALPVLFDASAQMTEARLMNFNSQGFATSLMRSQKGRRCA